MMERLTWRRPGDNAVCPRVPKDSDKKWIAGEFTQEVYNRLASYEDTGLEPEEIEKANKVIVSAFNLAVNSGTDMLIERLKEIIRAEGEGRLLVLPCKVGDTVYTAQRGVVSEYLVGHFTINNGGIWVGWKLISGQYGYFRMAGFPASDIGKTVFLTREEAEAAMKEE